MQNKLGPYKNPPLTKIQTCQQSSIYRPTSDAERPKRIAQNRAFIFPETTSYMLVEDQTKQKSNQLRTAIYTRKDASA